MYKKLMNPEFIAGFSTIVIAIALLGGVQLLTLGIIGEYIDCILDKVKQPSLYAAQAEIGFDG